VIHEYSKVKGKLNYLIKLLEDHEDHLQLCNDPGARAGGYGHICVQSQKNIDAYEAKEIEQNINKGDFPFNFERKVPFFNLNLS
jgi:hypothetical protein